MYKYTPLTGSAPVPNCCTADLLPVGTFSVKPSPSDFTPSLDTLGQLPLSAYYKENVIQNKKNLEKRARSKYVTNQIASPLYKMRSKLEKSYLQTLSCAGALTETAGKITAKYCDQRWCLVCSRIRTAKLIKGYMPQIEAMENKWFVTLTVPNCKGSQLRDVVKEMTKTASLCNRQLREKRKLKFSSLRKLECTYNEARHDYHPHFHFVFDDETAARGYLAQWLARNPKATAKAQDIRVADNNSCMEMFKYFTKVVSKTKGSKSDDYRIHITALDTMFQALQGLRTFQPCGLVKEIEETVEPSESLLTGREEENIWQWSGHDWSTFFDKDFLDKETGELLTVKTETKLTDFVPSEALKNITAHIVLPGAQVEAPDLDNDALRPSLAFEHEQPAAALPISTPIHKNTLF